jgi:hypothetical protein
MLLPHDLQLLNDSGVIVDTAGVSQWNRLISQLLPSISIIGLANSLGSI